MSNGADVAARMTLNWMPSRKRLLTWGSIASKFLGVQVIVQVIGFATGVMIVRSMNKHDYGLFTIVNSMQGTVNLLTDMGMGAALSSIGGKVWHDRIRFGQLLNAALETRRLLGLLAILVTAPILFWLLTTNGAAASTAGLLVLLLTIGTIFQLRTAVLTSVPRFHSALRFIQGLDLSTAALRLLLLVGISFWLLTPGIAVAINVISFAFGLFWLERHTRDKVDLTAPVNPNDKRAIRNAIKGLAASNIFYCFQGQISIWLISYFGNASATADLGALSRIGMIYVLFSTLMSSVLLPSFARTHHYHLLLTKYWLVLGAFTAFGALFTLTSYLFPREFLWILGKQYGALGHELFLLTLGTAVGSTFGSMWLMNSSRGWIRHAWLYIPGTILTQIVLASFLDLSRVAGVLIFGILSQIPVLLLNGFLSWRGFRMLKAEDRESVPLTAS